MGVKTFEEKASSFEVAEEVLQEREAGRLSFIEKFPLEKLKDLTLNEFVQGTTGESFCYWLEFKKIGFGIGGGNASKFGIYRTKNANEIVYARGSGKNKTFLDDVAANLFYTELRSKIIQALAFTANDEIDKIRSLEIPMWNMVLQKILSMYYPDKFLAIGSPTVLINCAKEIGIETIELNSENSIQINYACKKAISNNAYFANWSYEKIGVFIWDAFDGEEKKRKAKESTQYWMYAPGENAHMWDAFYSEGIMGLGWDKIGDLNQYKTREEIKAALVSAYGGEGSKMNDILANEDFHQRIKIGDVIIAKKGRNELLGYGVVDSDYFYDVNRSSFQKCRKVSWKLKGSWKVDFNLVLKTLTDITHDATEDKNYNTYYERLLGIMQANGTMPSTTPIKYPLNSIFYGPPGTGKTYNTVRRAAELIEERSIEDYSEALQVFNKHLHKRIEFITFHQNYSYEDFIQGLRPDTNSGGQLSFEKRDGIFKVIADRALKNVVESRKAPAERSLEMKFDAALELFIDALSENDGIFQITENCQVYEVEDDAFRYKGDNWNRHSGGIRMKFSDLKEFYLQDVKNRRQIKDLQNISALAKQHATYYFGVYEAIRKYVAKSNPEAIPSQTIQNYVLIIDEINRANISRVFGELITLIEPDKRDGAKTAMKVSLPSGDSFTVPGNLYIIGTMNTADKSIALLDIALRRRFEFEPMYPKYDLPHATVYDADVLKKINARIIQTKGHDFQIGHAYFMGVEETLVQRMNGKVIPLLLEYYMNDTNEVKNILRSADLIINDEAWPLQITGRNASAV